MAIAAGLGGIEAISGLLGNQAGPAAIEAIQAAAASKIAASAAAVAGPQAMSGTFGGLVTEALRQVNQSQVDADMAVKNLAIGKEKNLHSVMIALEEASLSMQFAMAIRNKVIEAYQEVSRMQV